MNRIRLSFYTNIPTPYQQDFFEALSIRFDLTVIYYAKTELDRQWAISGENYPYKIHYLTDTAIAKWIQKWVKDYHFSWSIVPLLVKDNADYTIISGAYWIPNAALALFISKIRGKKNAYFGERLITSTSIFKKYMKWIALLPVKWSCSRLIVGGKEAAKTYQSFGIDLPFSVIPYNIAISRFDTNNLNQEKLEIIRNKYKRDNQPIVLSSGSLIPRKNMNTVINAVKNSTASISLLIIGDGPDRNKLEKLIGTDERIHLLGFVQVHELPYYYNLADVFAFASQYDGWGVVINEAIAAGLPVICSNTVGAAREWIVNGMNGYLCEATDERAFQSAIEKLISSPELRQNQGFYNRNFRGNTSSTHYAKYMFEIVRKDLKK